MAQATYNTSNICPHAVDPLIAAASTYKAALLEMAQRNRFTHLLTLNTHRECSTGAALKHLKRWRFEVFKHLHGYRFYRLPADQLTLYMGFPEWTAAGHIHFHLLMVVPDLVTPKLGINAHRRWKSIMPSGTSHLACIGPDADDQHRVLTYSMKYLDNHAGYPFVDSRVDW
jgi:dihydroorotase